MNVFEKWDKEIDLKSLVEEVEKSDSQGEVPHGVYEVSIDKMELVDTKKVIQWFLYGSKF